MWYPLKSLGYYFQGLSLLSAVFSASLPTSGVLNSGQVKNLPEGDEDFNVESWTPSQELMRNFPYYLSGYDDDGRLIVVMEVGKWDAASWYNRGKKAWRDLDRYGQKMAYTFASGNWNIPPMNITEGGDIKPGTNEMVVIVDFDGLAISQAKNSEVLALLIKYIGIIEILQDRIHIAYFVYVNAVARAIIQILKPTLGKVYERVEVYGTLRSRWVQILRRDLPHDQIPESLEDIEFLFRASPKHLQKKKFGKTLCAVTSLCLHFKFTLNPRNASLFDWPMLERQVVESRSVRNSQLEGSGFTHNYSVESEIQYQLLCVHS
ncbi:unnamed protein product [Allacma fusca]|uniref:CRAL-TRIO domain-containing protein n=1 Tax=Allacma fusca TaxID=39272 RepID=A0A8J2PZ15_9HEXA|nr:unnamed protein product [Allacma fusca]